jgi:hypothetical protein
LSHVDTEASFVVRQGCLFKQEHTEREFRFFARQIQEQFRFEAKWYRTGVVAGLVLQYYALLRSVLRTDSKLSKCLTRCRHCRIFFVAAACNARRKGGCPFGCAVAHRQKAWRRTSKEYYRSKEGKTKKSDHNQRRRKKTAAPPAVLEPPADAGPSESLREVAPMLVGYVRRVVSAIERRPVSREEILAMLAKEKRQHSLARQRRIDQIIRALHERPP